MKKQLLLTALFLFTAAGAGAQEAGPEFLFPEYREAIVHLKGGLLAEEKVNYNMQSGALYFIDKNDGEPRVASGVENIVLVRIDTRTFVPDGSGFVEMISSSPRIYVQYHVQGRPKASKVAYGGTSELSSVNTYSEMRDNGTITRLREHEIVVTSRYNTYWIETGGSRKRIDNFKKFFKIYNRHKDGLERYVEENGVDFNDAEAFVELCKYAESL